MPADPQRGINMATMKQKEMVSMDEVRIMLLEQKNDDFYKALDRIDKRFDSVEERFNKIDEKFEKVDQKFDKINEKIDSHFRWTIGLIFGLYATGFATLIGAVGKAYHWF